MDTDACHHCFFFNIFGKEKEKLINRCRFCRTLQSLSWLGGAKIDGLRQQYERRRGRRLRRIDQKIVSMSNDFVELMIFFFSMVEYFGSSSLFIGADTQECEML